MSLSKYRAILRNINLGKSSINNNNFVLRLSNMLIFALGQKKMFDRPISGIFHFFIYTAFLLTQIELLEILIDGSTGSHRFFANSLRPFYSYLINFIEILSILAFISTLIFLSRRNLLKILRFRMPELSGWPSIDANIILLGEILLIIGIFSMNSADQILQNLDPAHYPQTGPLFISSFVSNYLIALPSDWLIWIERGGWWLHLLIIYGFIFYLPHSKHLHIFLSFPNAFYSDLEPRGKMKNIPEIENEARSMLGLNPIPLDQSSEYFGASDVFQLSRKTILEAYSCTECGRCTSVCPANLTGKTLSPRKIVMNIRDRAEEIGQTLDNNSTLKISEYNDGKSLFDYISKEEIYACTSCNACVEACPVLINPLKPILEMRRYDILMNSSGPVEWVQMFNSLENNQSVWQLSSSRTEWAQ